MNNKVSFRKASLIIGVILASSILSIVSAQSPQPATLPVESITAAELRDHIFFLASDYLGGRVATTAEYDIAARYVATQFASAGLMPVTELEDGSKSYFQEVPFSKTTYGENITWSLNKNGKTTELIHKEDFKILFASNLNHKDLEFVFIGYGIQEDDQGWNDFKNLDVKGKIMICMLGAPVKDGDPVFPLEINDKYSGMMGLQSKISGLFSKEAAGIILVDVDGSSGLPFDALPSRFDTVKYVYKGNVQGGESESIPSIYLVKPDVIKQILEGEKYSPFDNPGDPLKKYATFTLKKTLLNSSIEILSEEPVFTKNIIGMVEGTDPELKNEYIIIGAHLDHVKPVMGQVCNGADDNASGSAGVMEIAEAVAAEPFRRSVIFIAYTAEEMGLRGSHFFISSGIIPKEKILFNVNMDMIGRSSENNMATRAHYVVTHKKYVDQMSSFINDINSGVTDFPLLIENDEDSPGGSDHQSFISEGIPAFFFFSGLHEDLHQPGDDAEKIDYAKAESISRLAFLIAGKLANMDKVPDFLNE
ncbi:MAG: M20/M25/M40 family metallo-hydrolase [Bacteroidia bacterium]|nr:MAG: M20/M25/M40 family metallo-hydrolase [Bacteroidia bacterium]